MILKELFSENLYSFHKLHLDFSKYNIGTTSILGINKDMDSANGAGKSSLLKIIFYAFWGVDLHKSSIEDITHFKFKKEGFIVRLSFEKDGISFIITRWRNLKKKTNLLLADGSMPKNSGVEFLVDGFPFVAEKDSALVQNLISEKLGMSPKLFINAIYMPQKRKSNFLEAPDSEKKEILSELLDLGIYDKALDIAKKDIKQKEDQLSHFESKLKNINESINDRSAKIVQFEKDFVSFETQKLENSSKLKNQIKELKEKLSKLKNQDQSTLHKILIDLQAKLKEKELKISSLDKNVSKESKLSAMKAKDENNIKNLKNNIQKNNNLILEKEKLLNSIKSSMNQFNYDESKIKSQNNELSELNQEFKNNNQKINNLRLKLDDINKLKNTLHSVNQKISNVNKEINSLVKTLKEIEDNNKCDSCHRPFKEDENSFIETMIKDKREDKNNKDNELLSLNNQMTELSKEIEYEYKTKESLNKIVLKNEDINKKIKELSIAIEKEMSIKKQIDQYVSQQKILNSELTSIKSEIIENEQEINLSEKNLIKIKPYEDKIIQYKQELTQEKDLFNTLNKNFNNKKIEFENIKNNNEKINIFNNNLKNLSEQLSDLEKKENPYSKMKDQYNKDIYSFNEEKHRIEDSVLKLKDELKYLLFWKKGFSTTGIKSFITEDVIELLNIKVKENLDLLSNGVISLIFEPQNITGSGKVNNNITTKLYINGKERPLKLNSGGEAQRLILAVDLALSDVAELRSGTKFNIKFLDEPFNGMDSKGQIKALSLFNAISKQRSGFFIISHDAEMQSFCDNTILIEKENDISVIK